MDNKEESEKKKIILYLYAIHGIHHKINGLDLINLKKMEKKEVTGICMCVI